MTVRSPRNMPGRVDKPAVGALLNPELPLR